MTNGCGSELGLSRSCLWEEEVSHEIASEES